MTLTSWQPEFDRSIRIDRFFSRIEKWYKKFEQYTNSITINGKEEIGYTGEMELNYIMRSTISPGKEKMMSIGMRVFHFGVNAKEQQENITKFKKRVELEMQK